jgi:Xaa-Pro aminopeptidase
MSQAARVEQVQRRLAELSLDALIVSNPHNRRYLTGFTGRDDGADSAGTLVVPTRGATTLVTDGRYSEQAAAECPGQHVEARQGKLEPALIRILGETTARAVGIEAMHMTVARRDDLADAARDAGLTLDLVPTRRIVEALRVIKDADELAAIERAVAITDQTFTHLRSYLRPGLTEREVAWEVERVMRALGAERLAFPTIVASGPNAALPHAIPSDRPLAFGEPVTIDMGAMYAGYCSDMTRTVCLGPAPAELRAAYDAVLAAQLTCEEGVRPGKSGQELDALARDVLEARGRGEQYLHGTGHGVGLEIHEDPGLGKLASDQVMHAGMVITVEPGVYIAGWGGVRIEDTVLVTLDGHRVLCRSPKDFELIV